MLFFFPVECFKCNSSFYAQSKCAITKRGLSSGVWIYSENRQKSFRLNFERTRFQVKWPQQSNRADTCRQSDGISGYNKLCNGPLPLLYIYIYTDHKASLSSADNEPTCENEASQKK